jgi:hypothetical protein
MAAQTCAVPDAGGVQRLHDVRLVRPLEAPQRGAADCDRGELGIAFFEYMLAVPPNRIGAQAYTVAELKTIQEAITLIVFAIFSVTYLGEPLKLTTVVGFGLIFLGAAFVFMNR